MYLKLKKFINRRSLLNLVAILLIIYISLSTLRVMARNFRLQQEVDVLVNEISLLKLKNQELEYKIAYFKTDAFADKEARDKLNLQAPGEKVVVFPNKIPIGVNLVATKNEGLSAAKSLDNFSQWLYFLFKREPQ